MKNTIKTKKHKTFWGYNVTVSNGKEYFIEFNWEAPKSSAWMLLEGTDIHGYALTNASTKRECIEWIKYWNNID
jgi:hypothetical protein